MACCSQRDPSPDKSEEEVEANIPYSQFVEQSPPLLLGSQYADVGGSAESEWQIPTLGALPKPTQGFCNRDFRNPQTGESIIPTEVYVSLQKQVQSASQPYQCNFIVLVVIIQITVLLIPLIVIDFDNVDSSVSIYLKIACFGGCALLGLLIWKTGMQWINKSLHARMERVVEERQGTLMECGVTLGYSHETTTFYWNRSYLWLRRIPESQRSTLEDATPKRSLESTRVEEEQLFPPIFIHWLVPGEIHISEKEYDPSMVLDREVWTMIHKAHFDSFKPCNRYLAILMATLAIVSLLYSILISYFTYLMGGLAAWLVLLAILSSFLLTWFLLDRLNVKAWSQVADQVTLLLFNHENPNLNGTILKFETSLLPFRNRPMSRRYQLVRVNQQGLHCSPANNDHGTKVVQDHDGDYVHQIV